LHNNSTVRFILLGMIQCASTCLCKFY
jgi:hypothetical protein